MKNSEFETTQFLGKITAGVTHELQNILAIIKESSGLMKDLLILSDETPDPLKNSFQRSIEMINNQVLRGTDILNCLNDISHSPDQSTMDIDLYKVIHQLTQLMNRYSQSKQIELYVQKPDEPVRITINSMLFQLTISYALEFAINSLCPNGSIHITFEKIPRKTVIFLSCQGEFQNQKKLDETSGDGTWKLLKQSITSLKGDAEINPAENRIKVFFSA